MVRYSTNVKLQITGWMLVKHVVFVVAVVLVALLPGVSTLGALCITSGAVVLFYAVSVWFPAASGARAAPSRPSAGPAGDRSPRRPGPLRPAGSISKPLPHP